MPNLINKPLLVICGTTSTGKTDLALKLADKFSGDLISADSRQVFIHMDIGTGKDIPKGAVRHASSLKTPSSPLYYYQYQKTNIWGYDLVKPDQEISIGQYATIARSIINHIWQQDKLPILVGGSGLYINCLLYPPKTLNIPPNKKLRSDLNSQTTNHLQDMLRDMSNDKWANMNQSDRQNPRRLIRAIEIASSTQSATPPKPVTLNTLQIGLRLQNQLLKKKITNRVHSRIDAGFDREVKMITEKYHLAPHASSTLGYKEWQAYKKGETSQDETISTWINNEIKYAKRQITWFKKNPKIHWFDSLQNNLVENVVALVKTWYA